MLDLDYIIRLMGLLLISALVNILYGRHKKLPPPIKPDCSHLPPSKEIIEVSTIINKDPWAVFGTEPTNDLHKIKRTYRRLVQEHHPDKYAGEREKEERLKEIIEAYQKIRARL